MVKYNRYGSNIEEIITETIPFVDLCIDLLILSNIILLLRQVHIVLWRLPCGTPTYHFINACTQHVTLLFLPVENTLNVSCSMISTNLLHGCILCYKRRQPSKWTLFYIASACLRICIHGLIYNWLCFCVDCSIDKVVSMSFIA